MSQICNNCGQPFDDDALYCPHCGRPSAKASIDAKPLSELPSQNSAKPTSAPSAPKSNDSKVEDVPRDHVEPPIPPKPPVPPVHKPNSKQPASRRFPVAVALAVVAVFIVFVALIWWLFRNTQVTVTTQHVNTATLPVDSTGTVDADSIFSIIMSQTDSEAQAMMDSMERAFVYGAQAAAIAQGNEPQPQASHQNANVLNMAGKIGSQECILHLNVKNPDNIMGSARFVLKGKEGIPMKLLGIANGDGTLTVSLYRGEDLEGTLMGQLDGSSFSGTFTRGSQQIPFSFSRNR